MNYDSKMIFSPCELAKYVGLDENYVYSLFADPSFPCIKNGQHRYVFWDDYYEWLMQDFRNRYKGGEVS